MEKLEKFSLSKILEAKDDTQTKRSAKVGEWSGDELIVRTYPLSDIMSRIIEVGFDFNKTKKMETKLRKVLPDIIKKDKNYAMSTIDILADDSIDQNDKADMIDSNIDEFIDSHFKELELFMPYRRK